MEAITFINATGAVVIIRENHSDILQFLLGRIRSNDEFRPITRERNYLMDYNAKYCDLSVQLSHRSIMTD